MTDIFHQPSYPPRSASAPVWGYAKDLEPERKVPSAPAQLPLLLKDTPALERSVEPSASRLDSHRAAAASQAPVAPAQMAPCVPVQPYVALMQRATKDLEDCRQFLAQSQSFREKCLQALAAKPEGKERSLQDHIAKLADADVRRRAVSQAKVMQALRPILEVLNVLADACKTAEESLKLLVSAETADLQAHARVNYARVAQLIDECHDRLPQGLEAWLTQTAQCVADLGLGTECQEALAQAKDAWLVNNLYRCFYQAYVEFLDGMQQEAQ